VVFNLFKKQDAPNGETKLSEQPKGPAELLRFIVSHIVDYPDDIEIVEKEGTKATILELKVNDADIGKVIGKKGRIIKSLRIVLRAASLHQGKSVTVELASGEPPEASEEEA
jgi:predicted RNA-binding protein YlqC (UPF0109 family)